LLKGEVFDSTRGLCVPAERWCVDYNAIRRHSSLDDKPAPPEGVAGNTKRETPERGEKTTMILFYADPGSSSLLIQILGPVFVVLSLMSSWIKKKIVRAWQNLSRQFGRGESGW
jgi:hypothetical protein